MYRDLSPPVVVEERKERRGHVSQVEAKEVLEVMVVTHPEVGWVK